jgi:hypothetical protein
MNTLNKQLNRREFLKRAAHTTAATAVSSSLVSMGAPLMAGVEEAGLRRGSRISYFYNGEIHVNEIGKPEGRPLTTGHTDFKPSWSKTGDMLVCFRRLKDDPNVVNWKTAIFVIDVDGSGFHTLTDGTHTDFNPTWTRDGKNIPVWNRRNDQTGGFLVMQSKTGGKPGEEVAVTDATFHNWVHSGLNDGRILVSSLHPMLGWGVYLITRKADGNPLYERIDCELASQGQLHRASISPSEKKICFEYLAGANFTEPGHTLYVADFDAQRRTIANLKAFANGAGRMIWYAYPRWIDGESAIVYHSGETGRNQLYVYRLDDGSTRRVSTNPNADYRYPHGEAAPC